MTDFSHLALTVGDMGRARAVYDDILGFREVSRTLVSDAPSFREAGIVDAELELIFMEKDGFVVELQRATTAGEVIGPDVFTRGVRLMAFRVDDVDVTLDAIRSNGGTYVDGSMHGTATNAIAFARDPDGVRVEVLAGNNGGNRRHTMTGIQASTTAHGSVQFSELIRHVECPERMAEFYVASFGWRRQRPVASDLQVLTTRSRYYGDYRGWRGARYKSRHKTVALRLDHSSSGNETPYELGFVVTDPDQVAKQLVARGGDRRDVDGGILVVDRDGVPLRLRPLGV